MQFVGHPFNVSGLSPAINQQRIQLNTCKENFAQLPDLIKRYLRFALTNKKAERSMTISCSQSRYIFPKEDIDCFIRENLTKLSL